MMNFVANGHTMGLGEIDTGLTTTTVPLTAVSGESLDVTEFKTDDLIYNYQRNSSRSNNRWRGCKHYYRYFY